MLRAWFHISFARGRLSPGQRGFSPVEILLAATVFGFVVTALIGAIVYGRASTASAGERARAGASASTTQEVLTFKKN